MFYQSMQLYDCTCTGKNDQIVLVFGCRCKVVALGQRVPPRCSLRFTYSSMQIPVGDDSLSAKQFSVVISELNLCIALRTA